MAIDQQRSFTNPFDVPAPEGTEGHESMYPYYGVLSDDRREKDEKKFWFFDGMHNPTPIYPFDTIMTENWWVGVNQLTTRVWCIPPSGGIDQRLINGYLYVSPNEHPEPEKIGERAEVFARRAGHYYANWDEIYDNWVVKAEDCIKRLEAIQFAPLPAIEPEESVTGHKGLYSSYELLTSYGELIENLFEMGAYHFEMLNLGYGAYLTFREFCQEAFPGISDQTVARMVAGIDILLFRPDDEVRKLARLAVDKGLSGVIKDNASDPAALLSAMQAADGGQEWLDALEAAKEPWFWYSTGAGYTHTDRAWRDDLRLPFGAMRGYIEKIEAGEDIDRPLEKIMGERARITAEYADLLLSDEDREAFEELVQLARTVYPYVENHNFYVEHWHHGVFWNKVRELGDVFVAHGFFEDRDDIFLLHRNEIYGALYDLNAGWATMVDSRGPTYWPAEVAKRKDWLEKLSGWTPPPALGVPPEQVTEPLSIMLWGITTERIDEWLGGADDTDGTVLRGVAASPGKVRGKARVVTSSEQLHEVEAGDVLICRVTAPSWAPVFSKVAAAVSDLGGIMAHTAIVSREYGLPAVVGTGYGTVRIQTGQMVEVDGDNGVVTILEEGA